VRQQAGLDETSAGHITTINIDWKKCSLYKNLQIEKVEDSEPKEEEKESKIINET